MAPRMHLANPRKSWPSRKSCRAAPCLRWKQAPATIPSCSHAPSARPARSSCRRRRNSKASTRTHWRLRLKDSRLPNVVVSWSTFDKLDAADASVDVVTWYQGPHERGARRPAATSRWVAAAAFADIARVLKPGGYLVVMDHVAKAGSPDTSGNDLHPHRPGDREAADRSCRPRSG